MHRAVIPVCEGACVRACAGVCTRPRVHACLSVLYPGGGGDIIHARISAFQILYEIFVRNLFGVFKDLCRYTLGIAFAT